MRTIEEVEKHLRSLRLHGMAQTLSARCLQAQQNGSMSVLDVLTQLVQDELDCRQSRLIERRFHSSGLDERKIMQDFDWSYNPRLPRQEILELIMSTVFTKYANFGREKCTTCFFSLGSAEFPPFRFSPVTGSYCL